MIPRQTKPLPFSSLLLTCILLLPISMVLFSQVVALAETRYVKPSFEVVVRRGQGTEYKIIAMVKDGTPVDFLEEGEDFSRVRLANGKEGWMLKRFLSLEPPLNEVVDSLRAENEALQQKEFIASQQLEALTTTLNRTKQERDSAINASELSQTHYQKLEQETANVAQLKNTMQKITGENRALTQKLALFKQESDALKTNYALKWFLTGGGVLFFGMIIGGLARGSRKRKSSLL